MKMQINIGRSFLSGAGVGTNLKRYSPCFASGTFWDPDNVNDFVDIQQYPANPPFEGKPYFKFLLNRIQKWHPTDGFVGRFNGDNLLWFLHHVLTGELSSTTLNEFVKTAAGIEIKRQKGRKLPRCTQPVEYLKDMLTEADAGIFTGRHLLDLVERIIAAQIKPDDIKKLFNSLKNMHGYDNSVMSNQQHHPKWDGIGWISKEQDLEDRENLYTVFSELKTDYRLGH